MSLSGVIFDLDGTIAESHPMAIELFGSAIADHGGKDLSPEEVVALFGPNEQGILRAAVGDEHWEEAWEAYLDGYRSRHHELCPEPFPGMTNLLDRLHECGCRLGLVTGKTKTTGTISIEFFGLDRLFSGIEGGAMDGVVKAEAIDRLRASWDLPPETVAYVGDTTLDIRESRKAGVIAVGAAWSGFADRAGLAGEEPDALFDAVDDFARWLEPRACP